MSNDSQRDHDVDDTELQENPLAPPLKTPIEELSGSRWLVGGYNALEEFQRHVRIDSMKHHRHEVELWYRGLTLYFVAQYGKWDLSGTPEDRIQARRVQIDLLGLGLSSAKVAIDMLLAGYYSACYAMIRHMMETILQYYYVDVFPDRAYLWRTPPTPENIKRMHANRMREKLVKYAKALEPDSVRDGFTIYLDGLYRNWELMSAGSHPSGAGLVQVVWPESPGNRQVGGTYDRYMTLAGIDHGLFALHDLLGFFKTVDRVDDEWLQRYSHWERQVWDLRRTLKNDPAVRKTLEDLEAIRKAQVEADEGAG